MVFFTASCSRGQRAQKVHVRVRARVLPIPHTHLDLKPAPGGVDLPQVLLHKGEGRQPAGADALQPGALGVDAEIVVAHLAGFSKGWVGGWVGVKFAVFCRCHKKKLTDHLMEPLLHCIGCLVAGGVARLLRRRLDGCQCAQDVPAMLALQGANPGWYLCTGRGTKLPLLRDAAPSYEVP